MNLHTEERGDCFLRPKKDRFLLEVSSIERSNHKDMYAIELIHLRHMSDLFY